MIDPIPEGVTMPSDILNSYIAGAMGGCAGLLAGHPFDTVKVLQQTQSHKNLFACMKKVSASGMSSGFFRGLAFPLWSYGFLNSIYFGVYGNTLKWLTGNKMDSVRKNYLHVTIAGSVAGAAQVIPACPIEVIKVTLQSQVKTASNPRSKIYYKGPIECLKSIYAQDGIRGCFRGFSGQCLRDIPTFGLYILSYEWIHDKIMEIPWADKSGVLASLLGGGLGGMISWSVCIPTDCIKSRLQSDVGGKLYSGISDCVKKSYRTGGVQCFFKGGAAVMLRAFLVNAVTFLVYRKSLDGLQANTSHTDCCC